MGSAWGLVVGAVGAFVGALVSEGAGCRGAEGVVPPGLCPTCIIGDDDSPPSPCRD